MNLDKFLNQKIRNHIIIPLLILGIASGVILMYISSLKMKRQMELQLGRAINEWNYINLNIGKFLNILSNDEKIFESEIELKRVLKLFYENYKEQIQYVYFSKSEKTLFIYPETEIPSYIVPKNRPWFQKALEHKDTYQISDPYVDLLTNEIIVTISKYVKTKNGEAVIGVDINPRYLSKRILRKNILIVNKEKVVISSLDKKKIGMKLDISLENGYKILGTNLILSDRAMGDVYILIYNNYLLNLLPNIIVTLLVVFGILLIGEQISKDLNRDIESYVGNPIKKLIIASKNYLNNQTFDVTNVETTITEIDILVAEIADMVSIIEANFQELKATNEELEETYKEVEKYSAELEKTYELFIEKMATIVEGFDENTGNHVKRVQILSKFLAEKLGMSERFVRRIYLYSALHDIGKIKVPVEILRKVGPLSEEEWEIMKKHTIWGAEILDGDKRFNFAKNIALYHHEKYNGKGYPYGLKGDEIPIEAQIVNIVDVYDALRSERPYKRALSHEESMNIILKGDGRTSPEDFNPKILKCFKEHSDEIKNIWNGLDER